MPTDLQTLALRAVADNPDIQSIPLLTAKVREADGRSADLRDYIAAVKWALEHPSAANLPAGSVVATIGGAFFKEEDSAETQHPWGASHVNRATSDADIDELIRDGRGTILRVGTGS